MQGERKRFSVLLHCDERRTLERDVIACSSAELMAELQSRLSVGELHNPMFFDSNAQQYRPLGHKEFGILSKNVEIQVSLSPVQEIPTAAHGPQGPHSTSTRKPTVGAKPPTAVESIPQETYISEQRARAEEEVLRHDNRYPSGTEDKRHSTPEPAQHTPSATSVDGGVENPTGQHVEVPPEDATSRRNAFHDGTHHKSFKSRVVEYIRSLALPLFNVGKVNREDVIACCADVSKEFFSRRSVEESEQHGFRRELSLPEMDLLRVMVKAYHNDEEIVGGDRPLPTVSTGGGAGVVPTDQYQQQQEQYPAEVYRQHEAEGAYHGHLGREGPHPAHISSHAPAPRAPEETRRTSPRRKQYGVPSPAIETRYRESRPHRAGDPNPRQPQKSQKTTDDWRGVEEEYYQAYQPNPAQAPDQEGYARHSPYRGREQKLALQAAPPAPQPPSSSLFSSVSYTVAGRFPNVSFQQNSLRIGDSGLRITLARPTVTDADQDIVVIGNLQSRLPGVGLCWWLAYGPQRIVLNLDRMYASHFVTTYQISETSFLLAFRAGSLVPGWQYFVHVTATAANGSTSMAQTAFLVPSLPGEQPPMIGSRVQVNEMMVPRDRGNYSADAMKDASPPQRFREGYIGDRESGPVSHMLSSGEIKDTPEKSHRQPMDSTTSALPSALAVTATTSNPKKTSYHESLRQFFSSQIEPLYFLSPNPSMTEDHFRLLVKEVAKHYWLKYPTHTELSDEIKREIVLDVKAEISKARVDDEEEGKGKGPRRKGFGVRSQGT